jgi:hypothetical protein
MILLFKKNSTFTASKDPDKSGSVFPLINLPTNIEGTPTDLNDFQWWSYTDKWQEWLKKNPRSWTAEAESYFELGKSLLENIEQADDFYRQFFEFEVNSLTTSGHLSGFDEFLKVYEAEEKSGDPDKRAIRFMYAIEALEKSGELKTTLELDGLEEGKQYAVVIDPFDEAGTTVPEGRQALRFKKIKDTPNLIVAEVDYSIPLEQELNMDAKTYIAKVNDFLTQVFTAGFGLVGILVAAKVAGGIASALLLRKAARGIFKGKNTIRAVAGRGALDTLKSFFGGSPSLKGRTVRLPNGVFVKNGIPYVRQAGGVTRKLGGAVGNAAIKRAKQKLSGKLAAKGATKAGGKLAGRGISKFLGPVGLVLAAVDVVQSTYNWFSKNQAPRYGEVDDFASKTFEPGKIQTGKPITICWTNDAGGGWASYVFSTDTRTTMDLIKVADIGGLSYFLLLDVHSKELKNLITRNELVVLAFNSDDKFEHGLADNDDLEFETIALQSTEEHMVATSFYGYCDWDQMEKAYAEAPDEMYFVPEEAPDSYEFNFQNQDGNKLNVAGKLMGQEDLKNAGVDKILVSLAGENQQEVKENFASPQKQILNENLRLVSFSDFKMISEAEESEEDNPILNPFGRKKEDQNKKDSKKSEDLSSEEEWAEDFESSEKFKTNKEKIMQREEDSPYSRFATPIYRISTIQFVDPNIKQQAPEIAYFVVGEESFDASPGDPIVVEVTTDDPVYNPRYGLATYEAPKKDDSGSEKEEADEIAPLTPGPEKGSKDKIKASPDDVQIVDKKRRLVIKDDPDGDAGEDVNVAEEFLTPEQRKELGIENWKTVTKVTLVYDRDKKPTKVILRNKEAGILGDRIRRIRKGQAGFEAAVKFAEEIKDRISYK